MEGWEKGEGIQNCSRLGRLPGRGDASSGRWSGLDNDIEHTARGHRADNECVAGRSRSASALTRTAFSERPTRRAVEWKPPFKCMEFAHYETVVSEPQDCERGPGNMAFLGGAPFFEFIFGPSGCATYLGTAHHFRRSVLKWGVYPTRSQQMLLKP